jgi:hypothetical protein
VGLEVAYILPARQSKSSRIWMHMRNTYLFWLYPLFLRKVFVEKTGLGCTLNAELAVILFLGCEALKGLSREPSRQL